MLTRIEHTLTCGQRPLRLDRRRYNPPYSDRDSIAYVNTCNTPRMAEGTQYLAPGRYERDRRSGEFAGSTIPVLHLAVDCGVPHHPKHFPELFQPHVPGWTSTCLCSLIPR